MKNNKQLRVCATKKTEDLHFGREKIEVWQDKFSFYINAID